jgi:hypothetical protein
MIKAAIIRISLCALILALVLPSCSKTGPAGATGPQGPAGAQGQQGPKGDTGTANVIFSEWTGGFSGNSATWQVPIITQRYLDSAAILVFIEEATYVFQLPYDNANGSGFWVNDLINVGAIYLYCDNGDNLNEFKFRYMIIPGGVAATDIKQGYVHIAGKFGITP